jgi:hypothetical protein
LLTKDEFVFTNRIYITRKLCAWVVLKNLKVEFLELESDVNPILFLALNLTRVRFLITGHQTKLEPQWKMDNLPVVERCPKLISLTENHTIMDEEYFINLSSAALIIFKQLTRFSARSFVNLAEFSTRTGLLVSVKFHELSGDIGHFYDFLVHNPFLRQITISNFGYVDTNGVADNFALLLPSFGRNVTEFNMSASRHYYHDFSSYANLFKGFENMQICMVSTINCYYYFNKIRSFFSFHRCNEDWDYSVFLRLTKISAIEFGYCRLISKALILLQSCSNLKMLELYGCDYEPMDLRELCQNGRIEILLLTEWPHNYLPRIRISLLGNNYLRYVYVSVFGRDSETAEYVCKVAKEFTKIKFVVQTVEGEKDVPKNVFVKTKMEMHLI